MRKLLVLLHRWLGLGLAAFLFLSGTTGAVIAWEQELDVWLNPELFIAPSNAPPLPVLELVARVERADPRLRVRYTPLALEAGRTLFVRVQPRVDTRTGRPYQLGFDQLAIDPATGAALGRRLWGALSLSRKELLPFLYELHSSLHVPSAYGVQVGTLWMGLVALAWSLDAFVALAISFPSRKSWRRSFQFRFRAGSQKMLFDLHRSSGVWLWALLLCMAITGVSLTLREEVVEPVVRLFSPLTPSPLAVRSMYEIEPRLSLGEAVRQAELMARRRGITEPGGGVFYASTVGLYGVGFFVGSEHGESGLGSSWLYIDGRSGEEAGLDDPGTGSAGDIFLQAQFPVHSGRILGVAGRALVSVLGLVVAMLSATGVILWARKRARRCAAKRLETWGR